MGLDWCEPFPVGETRFGYREAGFIKVILDDEVTHISQSRHLAETLVPYPPEMYSEGEMISVALRDPDMPAYQAAEMLSDLFSGYYAAKRDAPKAQFRVMPYQTAREWTVSGGYMCRV